MAVVIKPIGVAETSQAAAALCELWPRYSALEITSQIDQLLRPNGYHLVGLWAEDSASAVCVLGYRIQSRRRDIRGYANAACMANARFIRPFDLGVDTFTEKRSIVNCPKQR